MLLKKIQNIILKQIKINILILKTLIMTVIRSLINNIYQKYLHRYFRMDNMSFLGINF